MQLVLLDSDSPSLSNSDHPLKSPADLAERATGAEIAEEGALTTTEERRNPDSENVYAPLPDKIGRSASMQRIYRLAQLVAPRTTTVLVMGPTGTGKELVARALHTLSPRAAKPFIAVNCAAIPKPCSNQNCLATLAARSPERCRRRWGASPRRMVERSFSTRSANCRWGCRPAFALSRAEGSAAAGHCGVDARGCARNRGQ